MKSSHHGAFSLRAGDHGWSTATHAGWHFPSPLPTHTPGQPPLALRKPPKAIGRGRAGGDRC